MPDRRNRPGPPCRYPMTLELALRKDQEQSVARIAKTLGVSRSEVIRWFVDQGVAAIESTPTYKTLEEMNV